MPEACPDPAPPGPAPPGADESDAADPQLRITVVGSRSSADVVVPADRPAALLMGHLVDLVGVAGEGAWHLWLDGGRALDPELTLEESGVLDGVVLRVLARPQVPAPPRVADLLEVMDSDDHGRLRRGEGWSRRIRAVAGALTVAAGAVCIAAALVPGQHRSFRYAGDAALLATGALSLSVLAVGVLPGISLRAGGLVALDARSDRGATLSREQAAGAVSQAHTMLLAGLLTCGVGVVLAATAVGHWGADDPWATGVAGAALLTWACRTRHFRDPGPRSVMVLTTTLAAAGYAATWGAQHPGDLLLLGSAFVLTGLAVCVVGSRELSASARAVGRRWVRRTETACLLALVPLLVAQSGLYSALLAGYR